MERQPPLIPATPGTASAATRGAIGLLCRGVLPVRAWALLRRQLGFANYLDAMGDRRRVARLGTFLNQGAFQFRQYPAHLPHGSARWGRGVNHFRERAEGHTPRFQIVQQADQIPQRAA